MNSGKKTNTNEEVNSGTISRQSLASSESLSGNKSNFIIKKVSYVGCIIVDAHSKFLLQRRDNKPGISNPGLLSTFGGGLAAEKLPTRL